MGWMPGPENVQESVSDCFAGPPAVPDSDSMLARLSRSSILLYLAAVALGVVFYLPFFLHDRALNLKDYYNVFIPLRHVAAVDLLAGRVPHWTERILGGYPLLSDPQWGTFYPVNLALPWIFTNEKCPALVDWYVIVHGIGIIVGGVFLGRSFVMSRAGALTTGLVTGLTGHSVQHLAHVGIIIANAVGPFALGFLVRGIKSDSWRLTIVSGLLFATMMLGSHPQYGVFFLYAAAFGTLMMLDLGQAFRGRHREVLRVGGHFALSMLVMVGAYCIQLLPAACFIAETQRARMPWSQVIFCQMPPRELPGLVMPLFYHVPMWLVPPDLRDHFSLVSDHGRYWTPLGTPWEHFFWLGGFAFVLGLLGWAANIRRLRVNLLLLSCVALVLAALGDTTPLYRFLYDYFPAFGNFRVPARLMGLAFLGWGLLAGLGVDALVRRRTHAEVVRAARALATAMLVAAAVSGLYVVLALTASGGAASVFEFHFGEPWCPKLTPEMIAGARATQTILSALVVAAVAVCFVRLPKWRASPAVFGVVCVSVVFLELALYGFGKNIGSSNVRPDLSSEPVFSGVPVDADGRIASAVDDPDSYSNSALITGHRFVSGYTAQNYRWSKSILPAVESAKSPGTTTTERLLDLWDVKYVVFPGTSATSATAAESMGYRILPGSPSGFTVTERPRGLPTARLVTEARWTDFAQLPGASAQLMGSEIDPRRLVLLDSRARSEQFGDESPTQSPDLVSSAVLTQISSREFGVRVETNRSAWLAVSRVYSSGWSATLDGQPTTIIPADVAFMAVRVPAGSHTVEFTFESPLFRAGAWISGATWLTSIGFVAWPRRRREWPQEAQKAPEGPLLLL
jgi:hypothetical protein